MGMRIGGERTLHVPAHLGIGKTPLPGITPGEPFFLCEETGEILFDTAEFLS